jgi:ribonuclease HII
VRHVYYCQRFAMQVKDAKELTQRQREYLQLLVWRHRRQIFHTDTDARAKSYIERMKS